MSCFNGNTSGALLDQNIHISCREKNWRKKWRRYHLISCSYLFTFLPFGGWDIDALKYLKEIARLEARRWGKDQAIEIKQFFQRLSITLQRGNAALLIDRDIEPT